MKATTFETVSPIFAVTDLARSLEFYCDLLGFEPAWTWRKPPQLAAVCRDKVEITLIDRADKPQGQARVYLRVTGIAALYAALERAGADIVVPIADRPYGLRDFRVRDPGGNELDIGEAIAALE